MKWEVRCPCSMPLVLPDCTPMLRSRSSKSAPCETDDGQIITGCNVENATYGLTLLDVLMFKAIPKAIAVLCAWWLLRTRLRPRRRAEPAGRFFGSWEATWR